MEVNKIYQGDCIKVLSLMESNTIDSIVTDPPYGLGFMGKEWDDLPPGREVFEQCLRVLKPGGHLLCFGGTRTYHRMAVAVEDAGFEIRDQLMWVYGSGFPKSQNIGKAVDKVQGNEREVVGKEEVDVGMQSGSMHAGRKTEIVERDKTKGTSEWEGWGTALKPAHEPMVLARKPIEKGLSIAQNCLKWGVGALNIDGCRVAANPGEYDIRHYDKEDCFQNKEEKQSQFQVRKQPSGRHPANFIHDSSDEVVELFPSTGKSSGGTNTTNPGGSIFGAGKSVGQNAGGLGDSGSAARFFYTAKATKKERGEYNNHPTVKPIKLIEYLIRLITPEDGTVLDAFAGSGTTGVACLNLDRNYILIEQDPESIKIANKRINECQTPLFK